VFLIDGLLLSPVRGLLWVARQLNEVVSQEREKQEESLKTQLRELYQRLEAGQVGEQEFEALEAALLDRLEALAAPEAQDQPAGEAAAAEGEAAGLSEGSERDAGR
jgi:hypothetical protein